jgi:flagellar motor switch protein FliN/FliY
MADNDTPGQTLGAAFLDASESKNGVIMDVNIEVVAVLGTAELKISQILQLGRGAVVELDHGIHDPVELRAQGRLIALGDVVTVEDKLAVQVSEIVKSLSTRSH